ERIAVRTETPSEKLRAFGLGNTYVDLNRIYHAAIAEGVSPQDPRMIAFDELRRNQNWLLILSQSGITPERAGLLLRLSTGLPQEEFAENSHLNVSTVIRSGTGKGRKRSMTHTENRLLNTANIRRTSKPAQLYRLITSGTDVLLEQEF